MLKKPNCPIVTLEEHYWDEELSATFSGLDAGASPEVKRRLLDVGEARIAAMDEAGIDIQVLSHAAPSAQKLPADGAAEMTRRVNDRLAAVIKRHPTRFAGFAALPTADPSAAADELSRCVNELGFKGAMLHGLTGGQFLDQKRYWPIYARAEALDVPIYLHPSIPHPAVIDVYYKDYAQDFPVVLRAAWGYTVETATQALRLVLSGVFDAHPRLKIILGHLGEGLPFFVWRIDNALARPGQKPVNFREVFCKHFYVTTSGFFSDPALLCCVQELGVDRILFSVDYPFEANPPGPRWLESVPLCDEDKIKIASGNAQRLLRL
ncbi:MAG TPA: amidohydrolase family protein [Xanthobacteraceae bacterium]|nr:amidohydrolase family protein [Xanthobacteraceae bacterium]